MISRPRPKSLIAVETDVRENYNEILDYAREKLGVEDLTIESTDVDLEKSKVVFALPTIESPVAELAS
jgi:hypothetical protein